MKKNNLAPIVLFVYARPDHTIKTIEFLAKNKLAKESKNGIEINAKIAHMYMSILANYISEIEKKGNCYGL